MANKKNTKPKTNGKNDQKPENKHIGGNPAS